MHDNSLFPLAYILAESGELSPPYALFHSGQRGSDETGRYSFLAYDAQHTIKGSDFSALRSTITHHPDGWWAGYFGYGLKNQLEKLTHDAPSHIILPDMHWVRFGTALRLDHDSGEIEAIAGELPTRSMSSRGLTAGSLSSEVESFRDLTVTRQSGIANPRDDTTLHRASTHTTFTREEYLRIVNDTITAINRGDFYEANITQKYWGELEATPSNPLALFAKLATTANTPYSALLCLDDETHIYSASPECFLKSDGRTVTSHPIKGSMKRGKTQTEDNALKKVLHQSTKNRAENLMIVDLIRNDLSRVCKAGSVTTNALYHIESFETIHHMVSQISGKLAPPHTSLDAVMASFPPGSMTGAPKIAAIKWCSEKERLTRGVYSGALGWMDGAGNMDLSVIIRTLIVQGNTYEYQTGGAIVADSTPEEEWDEMRLKAKVVESLFE